MVSSSSIAKISVGRVFWILDYHRLIFARVDNRIWPLQSKRRDVWSFKGSDHGPNYFECTPFRRLIGKLWHFLQLEWSRTSPQCTLLESHNWVSLLCASRSFNAFYLMCIMQLYACTVIQTVTLLRRYDENCFQFHFSFNLRDIRVSRKL